MATAASATAGAEDARSIARIYSAAFDRLPNETGLNFWVESFERGRSLVDIAKDFYRSPEFRKKYGPLTDRQYVEQLYRNVLGRAGEKGGVDFWVNHLVSGTSRARVLLSFSESPENADKTAPIYEDMHFRYDGWVFGNNEYYDSPVLVSESLKFTAIAAGYNHSCAIARNGGTYCWGSNEFGQLGSMVPMDSCVDGMYPCSGKPVAVQGGLKFTQLVAAQRHNCGLDASGIAYCWGYGEGGQLGDGQRTDSYLPVAVAGGLKFASLAATPGSDATCALTFEGVAWCWGINSHGALGNGTQYEGASVPARVMTGLKFLSISIGDIAACAVSTAREALCWGNNWYGQLGIGSAGGSGGLADSYSPIAVLGGIKFDQIVTDGSHACALQNGGAAYCWGLGSDVGTAAVDDYVSMPVPVEYTGTAWVSLDVGYGETCARTVEGKLYCWGQGSSTATISTGKVLVLIESNQPFTAYSAGGTQACAIGADGFAYCWGGNYLGQVGRMPSDQ